MDRYLNVSAIMTTTVLFVIASLVVAAVRYYQGGKLAAIRAGGWTLLAGSIASILTATLFKQGYVATVRLLFSRGSSDSPLPVVSNWIPFKGISAELNNANTALGLVNIFGNVALFVPTGLLATLLLRSIWKALILAPLMSTLIEFGQMTVGLSADVDDIIMNTIGGAVGVFTGRLIRQAISNRRTLERPDADSHGL